MNLIDKYIKLNKRKELLNKAGSTSKDFNLKMDNLKSALFLSLSIFIASVFAVIIQIVTIQILYSHETWRLADYFVVDANNLSVTHFFIPFVLWYFLIMFLAYEATKPRESGFFFYSSLLALFSGIAFSVLTIASPVSLSLAFVSGLYWFLSNLKFNRLYKNSDYNSCSKINKELDLIIHKIARDDVALSALTEKSYKLKDKIIVDQLIEKVLKIKLSNTSKKDMLGLISNSNMQHKNIINE